jgi:hypothetical protein
MSKTVTVGSVLNLLSVRWPRLHSDGFGARLADEVIAKMWMRYPWKESLADLTPIALQRGVADYGPPSLAVPPDFMSLHDATLLHVSGTATPLRVLRHLPDYETTGIPEAICYIDSARSFRVWPRPGFDSPEYQVNGVYRKNYTKVTNQNMNNYILPWEDHYAEVFRQGLVWLYKDFILGDPNAALDEARFYRLLDDMAIAEGIYHGVPYILPAEGIAM